MKDEDGEADRFSNRFEYVACSTCDEGSRWECNYCGEHLCAKCAENHMKKDCRYKASRGEPKKGELKK
jgi:hypothetical protein